jgi:branched-chain amino acid aminotransferase
LAIPDGVVDIDGVLHAAAEARISVFDRGFLYGDSAFEALRTYQGRGFLQRDHLERLARSCKILRLPLSLSLEALEQRIARAVTASGLAECYLRLVVTRGVATLGLDLSDAQQPSVLVYALALKLPHPKTYQEGIAVGLVRTLRSTDATPAAGAKASNYLAAALALDDVKARGCQEAILLGSRGEVLEGTTSNIFFVKGGELHTPALSAGILEGITRRTVLVLAKEHGLSCHEGELFPDDLYRADEVFITSSIREIVPVVRVETAVIGDGKPGPWVARLSAAYKQRTLERE